MDDVIVIFPKFQLKMFNDFIEEVKNFCIENDLDYDENNPPFIINPYNDKHMILSRTNNFNYDDMVKIMEEVGINTTGLEEE